jgi:hypothetical protein
MKPVCCKIARQNSRMFEPEDVVTGSSETLLYVRNTQRYIPDDRTSYNHRGENLKCYIANSIFDQLI